MDDSTRKKVIARLRRAEGQVAGILRMVEQDKYCVDILLQISAVQAAMGQVGKIVLSQHIEHCVTDAFKTGSDRDRQQKIDELVDVFARYARPRGG